MRARAVLAFSRDAFVAFAVPASIGVVLALALGYSSPNRSQASLREVPFASFVPGAAFSGTDRFIAGTAKLPFAIDLYDRASIEREIYTDDPQGFQDAFIELAHRSAARLVFAKTLGDPPLLTALRSWDTHSGYHLGAYVQNSLTTFTWSHRTEHWRAFVVIRDGPCVFDLGQECVPAE